MMAYCKMTEETDKGLCKLEEQSGELCYEAWLLLSGVIGDFAYWNDKGQRNAALLDEAEQSILLAQDYAKKMLANIHEMRWLLYREGQCSAGAS